MKHRLLRVNELLKRELSTIITREITFDGVLVTVNQVDVTPDLKHAHAYVSVLGKEGQAAAMAKIPTWKAVCAWRPVEPKAPTAKTSRPPSRMAETRAHRFI